MKSYKLRHTKMKMFANVSYNNIRLESRAEDAPTFLTEDACLESLQYCFSGISYEFTKNENLQILNFEIVEFEEVNSTPMAWYLDKITG